MSGSRRLRASCACCAVPGSHPSPISSPTNTPSVPPSPANAGGGLNNPNNNNNNTSSSQQPQIPITDSVRTKYGLSTKLLGPNEYERLILSLLCPLPNDQDMAISVCTLLSNETKHVLKFPKSPKILDILLAHAGVFNHCLTRKLITDSYRDARGLSHTSFWDEVIDDSDTRGLLCECYVQRFNRNFGIIELLDVDDESTYGVGDGFLSTTELHEDDVSVEEKYATFMKRKRKEEVLAVLLDGDGDEGENDENDSESLPPPTTRLCCGDCPCKGDSEEFEVFKRKKVHNIQYSSIDQDKIGQRINQIANIMRNLSFEEDNVQIMSRNSTFIRFILILSKCSWGNLSQIALDTLGNVAHHLRLNDPLRDPLSSQLLTLITSDLYSTDRFRVIRSLETLRELSKNELNEEVIIRYTDKKVYTRICQLMTISDIMLLIYTLECVLAMTGLGETICNEVVRVQGSITSLISLVTVEAQSYGPKGCIQMRVVETVTGNSQSHTGGAPMQKNRYMQQAAAAGSPQRAMMQAGYQQVRPSTMLPSSTTAIPVPVPMSSSINSHYQQQQQQQEVQLQNSGSNLGMMLKNNTTTANITYQQNQQQHHQIRHPTIVQQQQSNVAAQIQIVQQNNNIRQINLNPSTSSSLQSQIHLQQQQQRPHLNTSTSTTLPSMIISSNSPYVNGLNSQTVVAKVPTTTTMIPNSNVTLKAHSSTSNASSSPNFVLSQQQQQQQVTTTNSINLLPNCNVESHASLGEESWTVAWLKASFDSFSGASIEQCELYRMYSAARQSSQPPLSVDQFIQSVRNAFGTNVGPVIKQFGGSLISFINGIRPKFSQSTNIHEAQNSKVNQNISTPTTIYGQQETAITSGNSAPVTVSIEQKSQNDTSTLAAPTIPFSSNNTPSIIENKTLSPILKATLSRPPKQNAKQSKKQNSGKIKEKSSKSKQSETFKAISPSSSAIRSLLASKVAERQQKKLQEQTDEAPPSIRVDEEANANNSSSIKNKKHSSCPKENGIDGIEEESSVSSSTTKSSQSSESTVPVNDLSLTLSFQGILQNGLPNEREEIVLEEKPTRDSSKMKGMLIDLLERKVSSKEPPMNGVVGNREIRISDKGLELVDKLQQDPKFVKSANINENVIVANCNTTTTNESMTFYSSSSPSVKMLDSATTGEAAKDLHIKSNDHQQTQDNNNKDHQVQHQLKHLNDKDEDNVILQSGVGVGSNVNNLERNTNTKGLSNNKRGEDGADLIEKFSQISDLIMFPSEQLSGIKRSHTESNNNSDLSNNNKLQQDQPPNKKPNINGTSSPSHSPIPSSVSSVSNNSSNSTVLSKQVNSTTVPQPQHLSNHLPHENKVNLLPASSSSSSTNTAIIIPGQATANNNAVAAGTTQVVQQQQQQQQGQQQMMQVPLRFAMNQQNHLTFSGRQLMLSSGQQILLSTNSGPQSQTIQGQVLIQKPNSSSNDQIPKAIIILQQPQQGQQQHPQQQVTTQMPYPSEATLQQEKLEQEFPYLCEWANCGKRFKTPNQIYLHSVASHCPESLLTDVRCEWGSKGCDTLLRRRFSLMTHLQDRHCNKQVLDVAIYRRKNKIEPPPVMVQNIHHPGYAPNAAFHAIKRHALQFMNPKELQDDNEGPVTKSIRLTSALILKNLVRYSTSGLDIIKSHESHLAGVAMSNIESSRTISQLLFELNLDQAEKKRLKKLDDL